MAQLDATTIEAVRDIGLPAVLALALLGLVWVLAVRIPRRIDRLTEATLLLLTHLRHQVDGLEDVRRELQDVTRTMARLVESDLARSRKDTMT